ncbi:rho guanine nucleotide exchange factor 7-like isoform X3 [Lineus longissimus]|uniref:rho guanine nucleotide exchange factor 7-like isoform X3 n=1 Tax=Lineus longissimus TaxID=88925 RepID=UPI00315D5159
MGNNKMADTGKPRLVRASYNFKGTNNDELNFNKGDIITVTQVVEGGWWEGTLNEKTGWFPSNYVKEYKPDPKSATKSPLMGQHKPADQLINKRDSMIHYHQVVLQNVIETEQAYATELQTLLQSYLIPLQTTNKLTPPDYTQLCGNLEDVLACHQVILSSLDEIIKLPQPQQRIGGMFLRMAPQVKNLYEKYTANHPWAVSILQKYKEELNKYMEMKGSNQGLMHLTTCLSRPFIRLDNYGSLLKELERHIEDCHADRGDTQRALAIYKDIGLQCTELRKQKEIEFEVLTGTIRGWEGEEISKLGDLVILGQVQMSQENTEKKDSVFALFPSVLVILHISPRMSGYIYQGKLPLSGMVVKQLEDCDSYKHAFEISSSMIDRKLVICHSTHEQKCWIDALKHQSKQASLPATPKPQTLQLSSNHNSQSSITVVPQAKTARVLPDPVIKPKTWTMSCLRPSTPIRPSAALSKENPNNSPKIGRKHSMSRRKGGKHLQSGKVDDVKTLEDDAAILRVIESYCTSARTRHTVNSSLLDCPQVLIAEEEKIIIEDMDIIEEKTLVDTVYTLKDQIKELTQEQKRLRRDLECETRARKHLEISLRKSVRHLVEQTCDDIS